MPPTQLARALGSILRLVVPKLRPLNSLKSVPLRLASSSFLVGSVLVGADELRVSCAGGDQAAAMTTPAAKKQRSFTQSTLFISRSMGVTGSTPEPNETTSPAVPDAPTDEPNDTALPAVPDAVAPTPPLERVSPAPKQEGKRSLPKVLPGSEVQVKLDLNIHIIPSLSATPIVITKLIVARLRASLHGIDKKRRVYSLAEKQEILDKISGMDRHEALARLHNTMGYQSIRQDRLNAWAVPTVLKRMGRPVNEDFERHVLGLMIYTQVEGADSEELAKVLANVAYGYTVVKHCARSVQGWPSFAAVADVQKLKFSNRWVQNFIRRADMHQHRVCTTELKLPTPTEVQSRMEQIQTTIVTGEFELAEIVSADETGILYGAQPKFQLMSSGAKASAPESDEKAHMTDMLYGTAGGKMGSHFLIIKCSSKKLDLTGTRVLATLHQADGFTAAYGWQLLIWERTLTLPNRAKEMVTNTYRRPYLFCQATGDVITVQHKAWMDTSGCCMWFDLAIGPAFASQKACLIWDSCGPHCTAAVKMVAAAWGITEEKLPPNMTGKLQVMDLVTNGPLKAGIRRERVVQLLNYFQNWKIARLMALNARNNLPDFAPPKPTLLQGLKTVLKVGREVFTKQSYQDGIARCFVKVGQAKQSDGSSSRYTTHERGSILKTLLPAGSPEAETGTLATVAGGGDVAPCDEEPESGPESEGEEE